MLQKTLLIVLMSFVFANAFSQTTTPPATPAAPSVTNSIYKKLDYFHLEGTYSSWLKAPDSIKLKPLSRGLNSYITYPLPLGKSNFVFTVGAGVSVENIYYNARVAKDSLGNSYFKPITQTYKNNKLCTFYAEAPITIGYKTKPDRFKHSWKINGGLRVGYLLNTHEKYSGKNAAGETIKVKNMLVPNVNKLRFEGNLTFGYDWVYLVANYSVNTYFADGKGSPFHAFSVGVGVVGF